MPSQVTIKTGSRLHFGPLAVGATTGRLFGGVGLMIDSPGVTLTATRAEADEIVAPADITDRVRQTVARWRQSTASQFPVRLAVAEAIPGHQGLGSGTQLALAVANGLSVLQSDVFPSIESLAKSIGRGQRSAIGIHGFAQGGFLIDAGKCSRDEIGSLAARCDVPAAWRFVLITPAESKGLSGQQEESTFAEMSPMSDELTGRLCRIALTELLPSVQNADFPTFAAALDEFGTAVGAYFARVQGDGFADPAMAGLATHLRRSGVNGVAQSSWGPTIAVIQPDDSSARNLAMTLSRENRWGRLRCHVATPRNGGADIVRDESVG